MISKKLLSLGFACLFFGCCQATFAQVLFTNDFEGDALGAYSASAFSSSWNSTSIRSSNGVEEGRAMIVNEGSKALRVKYPSGLFGSGDDKTGAQWKMDLGQGYEAVELEYELKFEDGFDFVRGGKLPGLAGGDANSGGNRPDGTDGFSARMHWRTDGSSGSPLESDERDRANIAQYVYHPDQTTNDGVNGDDLDWDDGPSGQWREFESDRWYHVRHRIVMNTPGTPGVNGGKGLHDGVVQGWLDGEQVLDVDNIRFRDVASLQIDKLFFSTFFGGGSSAWSTTKDEYAYFDNFVISAVAGPAYDLGDFDNDGDVDLADLDQYIGNIGADATGDLEALDLDDDGIVGANDFHQHYTELVETSNGGTGTFAGDVNLDGNVDVLNDGFTLVNFLGTPVNSWSRGDLDANGTVDVLSDAFALIQNLGKGNSNVAVATTAAAVPEPSGFLAIATAGLYSIGYRRRRIRS